MKKRAISFRHYFLLDINAVIKFMIISDMVFMGAAGLLAPIFALFVEDFIITDNPEATAGIAAGIYLLTKSILQIPIAEFIDKVRGEKDDFWLMITFSLLIAVLPLCYLFIDTPLQLYLVQFVIGAFTAFTFPTYMAIFTRHIDKKKEGTEWGIYFTTTDLSGAMFAMLGGYLASSYGFPTLIITVVIISILGALFLWPIKPYLRQERKT